MTINLDKLFTERLCEHIELAHKLEHLKSVIQEAGIKIGMCFLSGNKVLLAGNGGSAADAQHWAAEWIVRFSPKMTRKSLPAIALTTDTSVLTAGANDLGYDAVLERYVEGIGKVGDVIILITTSGNSPNLIRAAKQAKQMDIFIIGVLGKGGGDLSSFCDIAITVPSSDTARIQEMHSFIGHMLCEISERYVIDCQ